MVGLSPQSGWSSVLATLTAPAAAPEVPVAAQRGVRSIAVQWPLPAHNDPTVAPVTGCAAARDACCGSDVVVAAATCVAV